MQGIRNGRWETIELSNWALEVLKLSIGTSQHWHQYHLKSNYLAKKTIRHQSGSSKLTN